MIRKEELAGKLNTVSSKWSIYLRLESLDPELFREAYDEGAYVYAGYCFRRDHYLGEKGSLVVTGTDRTFFDRIAVQRMEVYAQHANVGSDGGFLLLQE